MKCGSSGLACLPLSISATLTGSVGDWFRSCRNVAACLAVAHVLDVYSRLRVARMPSRVRSW